MTADTQQNTQDQGVSTDVSGKEGETQDSSQELNNNEIEETQSNQSQAAEAELKAKAVVQRLFTAKSKHKDIKNALKAYKISSEKLEELKKVRKDLTGQINEEKERIEAEFNLDKTYVQLREDKLDAEEKIALSRQELRTVLREQALRNEIVEIQVEVDGVPVKLQTQAKVAVYFNGREEK